MALANSFLGGAKGRLLAATTVFRFFGTALLFQVLAWTTLAWAAPAVPGFQGGLGPTLAAVHLLTLGVLVMTAIGASLQLLPVATRQAVAASRWPYDAVWALFTAGVAVLTLGMALAQPGSMLWGASLAALALLGYLVLLGRNLHGATGVGVVVVHGWAAALSLLLVLATGLSLVSAYSGVPGPPRASALGVHLAFAAYGFMGLLVMGFGHILVPMFALADNPSPRWSRLSLGLALAALCGVLLVVLGYLPQACWGVSIGLGAVALLVHIALMLQALRSGMRRDLGASFVLVRVGWVALLASLLVALARVLDAPPVFSASLFGVLLLGGLLTVLLGVLSRIVPFLAAMHAAGGSRRAPTPSSLTAQRPLDIHFVCHLAAMLGLLVAVLIDSAWLVRVSALLGLVGALAFGIFFVIAWRRMTQIGQKAAMPRG